MNLALFVLAKPCKTGFVSPKVWLLAAVANSRDFRHFTGKTFHFYNIHCLLFLPVLEKRVGKENFETCW